MENRSSKLRQLLAQEDILVLPGIYDALTAKIAEQAGFKALVMGGYSIAASQLGQPDVGYLGMTEMSQAVKNIAKAVQLPLIADGDTGYGNALSIRRTVQEYEQAGAAAIIFEDQVWPKRCGHMQGKEVIAVEEHVQKLKAAVEARVDQDVLIVARTDARAVLGLEAAIERGHQYLAAGADALFIEAPQNEEELAQIGRAFSNTILIANMIEGGKTPCLSAGALQAMGYKIVFWPCTLLYTVLHNVSSVLKTLNATGTTAGAEIKMADFAQFNEFIGLSQYRELEQRYQVRKPADRAAF